MKRKHIYLILAAALLLTLLCACGEGILPPKDPVPEASAPMPTPTPTPTPAPYTGSIAAVEINQGLSYATDAAGKLQLMENFVARRDTAVFVRLSEALGHTPDERDYLAVMRSGELLGTFAPGDLSTEDCLCYILSGEDAQMLTAGDYTFHAVVDDVKESRSVKLSEARALRVLLVPIRGHFRGEVSYPAEGWQDYLWHMQASWPLAEDGLQAQIAPGLDLSAEQYDLRREAGMWAAWEALREQVGVLGQYDLVIGLVNGMMGEGSSCGILGRDRVALISTVQSAPEAAISHFAAQSLGAGDEYEGGLLNTAVNPAPGGVSGMDGNSSTARGVENARDYGLNCTGSLIAAEQIPFDLGRMRLLDNAVSFMGAMGEYTNNYWISSQVWDHLFAVLTAAPVEPEIPPLPENTGWLARVSGLVGRDGSLSLRPLTTISGDSGWHESAESGAYRIVFTDKDGRALSRFWFDPDFLALTDPPAQQEWAAFDFALPVPVGAETVQIYGPGLDEEGNVLDGQLLGRGELSPTAPESIFTSLEEGQICSGITRVEWITMDEDELSPETEEEGADVPEIRLAEKYYELYFTQGDSHLLVYRGKTALADVDMLSLPGAERFCFTLLTSDGGQSTVTVSPMLRME